MVRIGLTVCLTVTLALAGCGDLFDEGATKASARVYYVSTQGLNSNDGLTPQSPKANIQGALEAAMNPGDEVRVAGGFYFLSSDFGIGTIPEEITLNPGVSLLGGYSSDFASRDPDRFKTTLSNEGRGEINRVIVSMSSFIGRDTVVEGFVLDGGVVANSAKVISIEAGSPTIRNNVIIGSGNGNDSVGVWVEAGSARIIGNTMRNLESGVVVAGEAEQLEIEDNDITVNAGTIARAISITQGRISVTANRLSANNAGGNVELVYVSGRATVFLKRNYLSAGLINGGANSSTTAVQVPFGQVQLINNVIFGGGGGDKSTGIAFEQAVVAAYNNTIHAGNGAEAVAVAIANDPAQLVDGNGGPVVQIDPSEIRLWLENNVFMGGGTCVDESGSPPRSMLNNAFVDCTVHYRDDDGFCLQDLDGDGDSQTCTKDEIQNQSDNNDIDFNVVLDNLQVENLNGADNLIHTLDDNDWRPLPPPRPEGENDVSINRGKTLEDIVDIDIENIPREVPWTIGAYQVDYADSL